MAPEHVSEAISALWELFSTWRRESAESADVSLRVAAVQLERLLSDQEMVSVWSFLAQNSKSSFNDVAAKLLLIELFRRAAPLPPWQA